MMIRSTTEEARNRFRMQFLNETRPCTFREDVPEIKVGDQKMGPFKAGVRTNLPNWALETLMMHDLVDIDPSEAYESLRRLQNLYNAEQRDPHKLQTFPPFLYSALSRKMHRLEGDKTSLDPRRHDEIEKTRRMLEILIQTRLSKVIRVAKSGANQDKRRHMTLEERWLCDELGILMSAWREIVTE